MKILGDDSYPEEHGYEMLECTFLSLPACVFFLCVKVCFLCHCEVLSTSARRGGSGAAE